jgi:hypothetical protein
MQAPASRMSEYMIYEPGDGKERPCYYNLVAEECVWALPPDFELPEGEELLVVNRSRDLNFKKKVDRAYSMVSGGAVASDYRLVDRDSLALLTSTREYALYSDRSTPHTALSVNPPATNRYPCPPFVFIYNPSFT